MYINQIVVLFIRLWIRFVNPCVENVYKYYPQAIFICYPQSFIKLLTL